MKSIFKAICGAAAVLLSLGLLLGLMGFALGGRPQDLADYGEPLRLPLVGSGRIGLLRWGNPLYGRDTVEMDYTSEAARIRKLDFYLSCADVTIREGDAFRVKAEKINADRFLTKIDGDTWEIDCDDRNINGRMGHDRAPEITITVPKGFLAAELEVESAMGAVKIQGLSARESSLKAGMGTMTAEDFTSGDCDLEIGMGTLELSGSLTGRGSIDCGMGTAILTLAGSRRDFGYTASVGMGSITIGGEELTGGDDEEPPAASGEDLPPMDAIAGFGGEQTSNPSAPNFFEIDCGMGSVEIAFTGE